MLREESSASLVEWLEGYDSLVGSNLVEAEVRSVHRRERIESAPAFIYRISCILPDRPISHEITEVLSVGYLRGADLWHVATALYYAADPGDVGFLTLDTRQRNVAEALGFRVV